MKKRNILFVGPPHKSGWGQACLEYLRALVETGHNIAYRPIYMSNEPNIADPLFDQLVDNHFEPDILIQNVLPHLMEYDGKFNRNIGLIHTETKGWRNVWPERLNLMDEVWVPSNADVENCGKLSVPITRIPIPTNVQKYAEFYPPLNLPELENCVNFYWIGELNNRKGLDVLIRAFHLAFDHSFHDVNLLIKTHKQGFSDQELGEVIRKFTSDIKKELKLYPKEEDYKEELVIPTYVSNNDLYSLHRMCQVFVMPSRGESCCMPALDAAGFGNIVIGTNQTGMSDFCSMNLLSTEVPVTACDSALDDLYTAWETYREPNLLALVQLMQEAYRAVKDDNQKYNNTMYVWENHNYKAVAERINKCLEQY